MFDKPANISSFGVVAKIRGHLKTELGHKIKVGHTGTLDPFATGLLILLTGKMTKRSNEFLKLDKVYEATLKLGYTSTTGDPEGEITKYLETNPPHFTKNSLQLTKNQTHNNEFKEICPKQSDIELVCKNFLGPIVQTPPKFSAVKINGQRAYKLARKGQDFKLPSRKIKIYCIDILDYHYPELTIRIHCSSGTYIRTLAEDIGKTLRTGAYLTSLRRIKIGSYDIKDAVPLSNFTNML